MARPNKGPLYLCILYQSMYIHRVYMCYRTASQVKITSFLNSRNYTLTATWVANHSVVKLVFVVISHVYKAA